MTATVHVFPEQGAASRADVLAALRRARRALDLPGASGEGPSSDPDQNLSRDLQRWADALDEVLTARAPAALMRACAAALEPTADGLRDVSGDAREAIDRALAAVVGVLEDRDLLGQSSQAAVGRPDPSIAVLFPTYRSLRHLAGAQRVHPAELWLGVDGTTEVPSDAGLTPQACDAAAVADLEAALLRSLRQPDALSFGRLSDLCAALGAADLGPTGTVWRLASTVFEAQRERLLEPDVYLKRLGSQLLSLARAAAGAAVPAARALADEGRLASLTHELWFFVVHAAPVPHGVAAPRTAALREALALRAAASTSVPPAAAPATLLEAVPGLPSPQDLDLSLPEPEEPADAVAPIDDAVKVVGPLRIEIERFNRFLVEADELSRQLGVALGEWSVAADAPLGGHVVAMAQALAVEAAAVGHAQLSSLCAVLARALARSAAFGRFEARDAELFQGSHEEVSRLLHQFAAGFLKPADERRMEALRGFAGDETSLPGLPETLQPLARQADAARRRLAAALTALREQTADATAGSLDLEALDAVDREAQTLMALFDDLCAHWPASEAVPKA